MGKRNHLTWLIGALIAAACLDVVFGVIRTHLYLDLLDALSSASGAEQARGQLVRLARIDGPLLFISVAAVGLQLARLARTSRRGAARTLVIAAVAVLCLAEIDAACRALAAMASSDAYAQLFAHRWLSLAISSVHLGWVALAAAGLGAMAARHRDRAASVFALIVAAVIVAVMVLASSASTFSHLSVTRAMWLQFGLFSGVWSACLLALAFVAWRLRQRSDIDEVTEPAGASWQRAAGGLHTYSVALSWRLGLTLAGYGMLLFAGVTRSAGLASALGWMLPLLAVAAGGAMVVGLARFAAQPPESPGKRPAMFAVAMTAVALLLDSYVLVSTLGLMLDAPRDVSAALALRTAAERLQLVGVWATAAGFIGLLAILVSFRRLAGRVADDALASRVLGVGAWLLLAGAAAVSVQLWLARAESSPDLGFVAVAGSAVALAALIAIVAYIELVRRVEEAIRERGAALGLPASRARAV